MKTRTESTLINTSFAFLGKFIFIITNFLLRTVFIRKLGIEYVGVSGLFTDILTLLSLTELGISSAISYSLYEPIAKKNDLKISQLMNFYKKAYRVIGAAIFLFGLLIVPFLNVFVTEVPNIDESIKLIFFFYILKTTVSYLLVYKSTLLVAQQKQYIISWIELIVNVIKVILESIFIIIFQSFISYLVIEVVANVIQNILISKKVDKENPSLNIQKNSKLSKRDLKKLLLDVKGLSMFRISSTVGQSVDSIVISTFISTATLGLMSNYTLIKNQIFNLLKQFYNAIIPSIGNLAVEETREKQAEVFSKLYFVNFWLTCFCSISFIVLIGPFISLWIGSNFLMSTLLAYMLAVDFFLSGLLQPIVSFRTANGLFVQGQYRPLFTTGINVVLSLIFVKIIGLEGVVIATIVSKLVTQWYDPWLLYKVVFFKPYTEFLKVFSKYALTFLALTFITNQISKIFFVTNLMGNLIIQILICLIVPNILMILLYFKTNEFQYLVSLLTKMVSRRSEIKTKYKKV